MLNYFKKLTRPYRWLYRMIHRGGWSAEEFPYAQLHFAQFGEDCVLLSLFSNVKAGFFIDVGAFHPVYFSNTHQLSELGWTGINIEPNPQSFKLFATLRPNDLNLNIAVAEKREKLAFICDGPYSGLQSKNYLFAGRTPDQQSIYVETFPLSEIVAEYVPSGRVVDLLTIDCEGADLAVLKSADWSAFRPRVVLVEDHSSGGNCEIIGLLEEQGYLQYCRMGLTRFFLEPAFASGLTR